MHMINTVDSSNDIVVTNMKIDDFAVKLEICHELPHKGTFIDEARQYVDNTKDLTVDGIEMSNLIDNDRRVTFVRGIAGMGKSVFAKQLTYGWAKGEMYQNFKICVMFECRDLNEFKDHKGDELEKHQIIDEFLERRVKYDLGDGEGVLFVVDGLDELYDITEEESIIFDLLNINGNYYKSKVIITGRPHVLYKLEECNVKMGGLRKVDILGLSNIQIQEYITKIATWQSNAPTIRNAEDLPKRILPLLRVPQLLNIYSILGDLTEGKKVKYTSEFYCSMTFILVKQALEKQNKPTIRERLSEKIMALSKVGYNLLAKNTIISEGDIDSLPGDIGIEKDIIESLFCDISDRSTKKYQIKNLLLIEFLSAVHIYSSENCMEIIQHHLENGWIEVVSLVCQLVARNSHQGIVQELLTNALGLPGRWEVDFLESVLKAIHRNEVSEKTKFERSIQIIALFFDEHFTDRPRVLSIMEKLKCWRFYSNGNDSNILMEICDHLKKRCHLHDEEIREAFHEVSFQMFIVNDIGHLDAAKYFTITTITLEDIQIDSGAIEKLELTFEHCESVIIKNCVITDEENRRQTGVSRGFLDELIIRKCTLTYNGFRTLCDWGASSKVFEMWYLGNVECWSELAEAVKSLKDDGNLKLEVLQLNDCSSIISEELWQKVRNFTTLES